MQHADKIREFENERSLRIAANPSNTILTNAAREFMNASTKSKYSYNFSWLGRPIIQYPQDIVAMQEIIWKVGPDLIIETGVAHGGSVIFYASMLELLGGDRIVLGIDIEIRPHNRAEIESHPMFRRIRLLEGSSVAPDIAAAARREAQRRKTVLVVLDSNHTHEHVLRELQLYAPLVSLGSYCVVFDTIIDHVPPDTYSDRPWGPGNNPATAVRQFLQSSPDFVADHEIDNKLLISVAPYGFLRRISL